MTKFSIILYFLVAQTVSVALCQQQFTSWATLGFIASICQSDVLCQALCTPEWIDLLLSIVSDGQALQDPKHLPRRVSFELYYIVRCCVHLFLPKIVKKLNK